jgi:hypothetical protein
MNVNAYECRHGVPVVVSSNLTAPTSIFKELQAVSSTRLANFLAGTRRFLSRCFSGSCFVFRRGALCQF